MGSEAELGLEVVDAGCHSVSTQSSCVDVGDTDTDDAWSGVELALALVDQMVGGLAQPVVVSVSDVTDVDDDEMTSRDDVMVDDSEGVMNVVDDDACRGVTDACNIL